MDSAELYFLLCGLESPLCGPSLDLDRRDCFTGKAMHAAKDKGRKRALLLISLGVNLGLLAYFKYANFFVGSAALLLGPLRVESAAHPSALPNAHFDEIPGIDKTDAAKLTAALLAHFDFKGFPP